MSRKGRILFPAVLVLSITWMHIFQLIPSFLRSFFFSGHPILHPPVVMEELGGRKDHGSYDGPRHRGRVRSGEEAEEETLIRLPLRQFEKPQLVGIQIFLLRTPSLLQYSR